MSTNEENMAMDSMPGNPPESTENQSEQQQETNAEILDSAPESEEELMQSQAPVLTDEEIHEEEIEVQEDYSTYSREELIALLEKHVAEADVPKFKAHINAIRDLLNAGFSAESEQALAKFIEDGGNKDDFKPANNPLEERFHQALKKFNKRRLEYQEKIEKQRQENLNVKNDILKQLKELIQNEENMNKAFEKFHELQAKWRSQGPVPSANVRDLQMTYKFYIDKFYDFIKINRDLQDLDQRRNLEAKLHLCEQVEELLLEQSLNTAFQKLYSLQDKWRETGPVPRDKKNEIWDRFKTTCDKIFERRKEYIAQADEKRAKNLELKTALCDQAEAIKPAENWKHKDWQEGTQQIMELQTAWKKIGPADKKVNEQIWSRFKGTCDAFYKSKNDFYHKRKQEFASNLQLKTELCIQAEALQNSNDWKSTTAELIRLQQEWKKIGPVGEKQSDKIWKRFRTACDAFFNNKSEHFSVLDKEHEENLIKKVALIEEIEKFQISEDTHADLEQLKTFQRQWSELGLVPLEKKDEIQKRFRKAIDSHYEKLKISNNDQPRARYTQKFDNNRTHADSPRKMDDERRTLLNQITELKNEVQVWENNIGFFAKSKNADKLKSEFEEKIKTAKEEINKLKDRLSIVKD